MGMKLQQFARFMGRVDESLGDLFPATLRIAGQNYQATGVGGSAAMEYLEDGGQAPTGMKFFRLSKAIFADRLESGARIHWLATPASQVALTVIDCSDRPHETSWVLRCLPSDR